MRLTAQQQAVVSHRGRSLLVSASAGSGKTAVLAERVVGLLAEGGDVQRMLIVTFTRAAAAELRARIGRLLDERIALSPPSLARRLRAQRAQIELADIGTIDAWCGRLVRDHHALLGIDPAFRMLGEDEAALLREQELTGLFDWVYASGGATARAARDWIRLHAAPDDRFLRDMVRGLSVQSERLMDAEAWRAETQRRLMTSDSEMRAEAVRLLRDALVSELQRQIAAATPLAQGCGAAAMPVLRSYESWLGEQAGLLLRSADQVLPVVERFAQPRVFPTIKRSLPAEDRALLESVRERWFRRRLKQAFPCADVRAAVQDPRAAGELVQTLLELVGRYERRLTEVKRRRGALEFGDVLRLARRLLAERTEVAQALQARLEHVIVDEVQDTSALQVDLLERVARLSPGNRFLVGDAKQSIYGFRQAEPRLFGELRRAFESGAAEGAVLPLADNFRSHPDLVHVFNGWFSDLFDDELGGARLEGDEALQARREAAPNPTMDAAPRVRLHIVIKPPAEPEELEAEQMLVEDIDRQAALAAAEILRLRRAGEQTPEVDEAGVVRLRPVAYRDCVILLRSAAKKAARTAALLRRWQVPSVALGRESVMDCLEVRDVVNALRLLRQRDDDIALAAYLRGPMVGLREQQLLSVAQARPQRRSSFLAAVNRYCTSGADADTVQALRGALQQLDNWRVAARTLEPARLIQRMLRETQLTLHARALPQGRWRAAQLQALVRAADARPPGAGLDGLVEHLVGMRELNIAPMTAAAPAEDAVRIMTIHAAKGLEFPIVFLLDAAASARRGRDSLLLEPDVGLGLRFEEHPSGRIRCAAEHIVGRLRLRERETSEELRLLYVAATRARERLIVVGAAGEAVVDRALGGNRGRTPLMQRLTSGSPLEWLLQATAASGVETVRGAAQQPLVQVLRVAQEDVVLSPEEESAVAPVASAAAPLPADRQWQARTAALLTAAQNLELARKPAAQSVSALKRVRPALPAAGRPRLPALAEPPFAARREDGRVRGTAVHRALQWLDLGSLRSAEALRAGLDHLVGQGRLTTEDRQRVSLEDLTWFGGTADGAWLASHAAAARREVGFAWRMPPGAPEDQTILRGVIDCVVETSDGLVLIDYKTDAPGDALLERVEDYRLQLRLYAQAAAQVFDQPVRRLVLVLLAAREVIDVSPDAEPPTLKNRTGETPVPP